jgi:hypothetical protein
LTGSGSPRKSAEAISIQPAQQFGGVLTGILPSQVTVDFQDANWLQQ